MQKLNTNENDYIRLLKPSFSLIAVVWLVAFALSFITAIIFDMATALLIGFIVLNILSFGLASAIADFVTSIAEKKRKHPSVWFVADIEREKRHYGPLRANRLFGHPIGKKKWF